jgi:alpha-beta hydrolase superfamily lysophospholipase
VGSLMQPAAQQAHGAHELALQMPDGTGLFVCDHPVDQPFAKPKQKRGLVLMHGLGEHSGRYPHVVRFFNECGWSVRRYDHRGHGRSGGPVGDIPDNEALLRDAKLVIEDFTQQLGTPPLLFGHSMGGLFASRFALAGLAPLRGLILSSPALALWLTETQRWLLKICGAFAPGLAVPNGLETRYLSHDPKVIDAYEHDPLVHPKISARLLNGMIDAIRFSQSYAAALAIPTLIAIAGDDHLVDPAGSKDFFAKLAPGVGEMHYYPSMYHELFNELNAQPLFDDVRAWLARQ